MTSVQMRQRKRWDTILTIVLLILFLGFSVVCAVAGALIALLGGSCGASSECNDALIAAAVYLGMLGPAVLVMIVAVIAIVRLVRRRIAFFVPLIGSVLALAIEIAAFALASSAVVPS